jgi:hypothetical protein
MEICKHKHEEIVYDGGLCPLCEANEKIEELENDKEELEYEMRELQEQIHEDM